MSTLTTTGGSVLLQYSLYSLEQLTLVLFAVPLSAVPSFECSHACPEEKVNTEMLDVTAA